MTQKIFTIGPGNPSSKELQIKDIKRPLVFIPGIMGSKLYLDGGEGIHHMIWPPIDPNRNSFISDIKPTTQSIYREPTADGLFTEIYHILITHLRTMGYKDDEPPYNFRCFTYDWRMSCKTSAEELITFLKDMDLKKGDGKVDLICHSMGGIVARAAYKKEPDLIERIIYMGTPHYGSPKAYFVLHPDISYNKGLSGFIKSFFVEMAWDIIRKPGDIRDLEEGIKDIATTFESVYELLPDKFFFEMGGHIVGLDNSWGYSNPVPVDNVEDTYFKSPTKLYHPEQEVVEYIKRALKFKEELGAKIPPEGNKKLLIYSDCHLTDDRVEKENHSFGSSFNIPYSSTIKGDGTVPRTSATAAHQHSDCSTENLEKVTGEHMWIPSMADTIKRIHKFLSNNDNDHSNQDQEETDSEGNHIR